MDDLLLFRLLRERRFDAPELPALLAEAAKLPLAGRAPFLGLIPPLFESPSALREVALGCLRGCEGVEAIELAAGLLSDDEAPVREGALAFFRQLSLSQPQRWVHVAFHPDERVRRASLADGVSHEAASMALALLNDPACREQARARFVRSRAGGSGVEQWPLPENAPPMILDLVDAGVLSRAEGRAMLMAFDVERLDALVRIGRARALPALNEWLQAASVATEPPPIDALGSDDLDRLVDLIWLDGAELAAEQKGRRDFAARLSAWSVLLSDEVRPRFAVAMLRKWIQEGAAPCAMTELLVEVYPPALAFAWLPRSERRSALGVFYRRGDNNRKLSRGDAESLIESDLAVHPEGGLDLWALGALLRLMPGAPFEVLLGWVRVDLVADAFCLRIEESMPLLSLEDRSHLGTAYLLDELRKRLPDRAARLTALWALTAPLEQLEILTLKQRDRDAEEEEKKRAKKKEKKKTAAAAAMAAPPAPPPAPPQISAAEAVAICEALLAVERQGAPLVRKRAERLAEVLRPRVSSEPGGFRLFLASWLASHEGGEPSQLSVFLLVSLAQSMDAESFAKQVAQVAVEPLLRLLEALSFCSTMPFAKERALAQQLLDHPDARVREWSRVRVPVEEVKALLPSEDGLPLSASEASELAICPESALPAKVRALGLRRRGLTAALAVRPAAPAPDVCVALLSCEDPVGEVDRELGRFGKENEAFLAQVQARAVERLNSCAALPALGHAWLSLWERHAFAFIDLLCVQGGTLESALASYLAVVNTPWVRARLLEATGRVVGLFAYRDRERLTRLCTLGLVERFTRELGGAAGHAAAEALVFMKRAGVVDDLIASVQPVVQSMLPELSTAVRERLSSWIDSAGLPPPVRARAEVSASMVDVSQVRGCSDLDQLEGWCHLGTLPVVEECALRLLDLGEPGLRRAVEVLRSSTDRMRIRPFCTLLDLWPEGDALREARALLDGVLEPEVRFALAMAFVARGDESAWGAAIAAACLPEQGWFAPLDWASMVARHPDRSGLARALAASPQPHAYSEAVQCLLSLREEVFAEDVQAGLLAFLGAGTARLYSLRRRVALWLHRRGAWQALPVLIQGLADGQSEPAALLGGADADTVSAVARSLLLLGGREHERTLVAQLAQTPDEAQGDALERVVARCVSDDTRRQAVKLIESFPHRSQKIAQIAETFAWGVHRGRELLGALYKVEMVDGQGLGYTRLNERRVFVSPLPILRRERHGRELVEALILHELGHHRYHKGDEADRCWKEAHGEHISGLYNLVLDEHLERNLRATDESFGDRLKRLTAYAFQHSDRAVDVTSLLSSLGLHAPAVLAQTRLRVARASTQVVIESGPVLQSLERQGMAFSRFIRALRMGLGNRHQDLLVSQALALFKGSFRHQGPAALLEVARALKRLFGMQASLLECTGSHESLTGDTSEGIANSDAISPQEIEEEVERVLNPRRSLPNKEGECSSPTGRLWINVNPAADFSLITSVTKLDYNRAKADELSREVRRSAFHLRRFLEDLGLARVPERRRLQGHRFDPSRAQAMVLRNDPRVLIARRLEIRSDVFLSVVVDCSGSMQCSERITRARLFAALIAEAAQGLHGIDVRVFGFTDQNIYDAGDAAHCAAHALVAGGGNNDAAALWHAAQVARRSRRKARVLVMISDGLPTECSVTALRSLVEHLTRRERMVCAQVAVAPITEVCFPHHVLLNSDSPDEAVRRFGALIGTLVRRSMTV